MYEHQIALCHEKLDLSTGSCFGAYIVVIVFNMHRTKMWSSTDVKLERGHLERTKKTLENASESRQEKLYKIDMAGVLV